MLSRFSVTIRLLAATLLLGSTSATHAKDSPFSEPQPPAKRAIGVVFAYDQNPMQASIDFYRAVYKALSQNATWEALPLPVMRSAMPQTSEHLGGLPTIDRESFRRQLPRRKKSESKVSSGSAVPELQRFLDRTRAPAVIVVDCARKTSELLHACALYYYDRVASRVTASAVKTFISGVSDASLWAGPMLKNLEDGIAAAQRTRDQAVIDELVARGEEDESSDTRGLIAIYGKGDKAGVSTGWRQTIAGAGLQLGFLTQNVGAYADLSQLSWSGSSNGVSRASRLNYGLSMMFRAKALDSLLWYLELGGGKEKNRYFGLTDADSLTSNGLYVLASPGIGLELSEAISLNLNIGWHWYFEGSTEGQGSLQDASSQDLHGPSLMLRAMILI